MKILLPLIIILGVLFTFTPANAQITGLTVNGFNANFTLASGDSLYWSYNLPTGTSANGEFWYDVNGNGVIDPGTDIMYASFSQTDGDTSGNNGPWDMDGLVNGHIGFGQKLGVAPGKYIFKVWNAGGSALITGTVTQLINVAHQISGHVTVPAGYRQQWILIEAIATHKTTRFDKFWDAFTDASGNYTIKMNADTAGNPWVIGINNNAPSSLLPSPDTSFVISGSSYVVNFSLQAPAAKVTGKVLDDLGNPLSGISVHLTTNLGGINGSVSTDNSGFFQLGLPARMLPLLNITVQTNSGNITTTTLQAQRNVGSIGVGDSVYKILVVYSANSYISGHLMIDGHAPHLQIKVGAHNADTAQAVAYADSATGNFSIPVSNKIYNYMIDAFNLGPGYNNSGSLAHPGDTGVFVNITTTGVSERNSGVPGNFVLHQNYPNPFNPTTVINYQLPAAGKVTLKVYDILGRELATLVDGLQTPGDHFVQWDGSALPSGVYFYRIQSGLYSETKKLLLMR
ncbi:MAG: T9SS type A sorting domain-containing protein [Bacteroidota bacterium]